MPKIKKKTTTNAITKSKPKIIPEKIIEKKIKPEGKAEKKTSKKTTMKKKSITKRKNKIKKYDETYISSISEKEKLKIQKITEELRNKNLGIYDFKNMVCRIHEIPLRKYKTLDDQEKEPYAIHCPKCVPIPENWELVS
ncbi:MAG: hypothetical protein HeimC3_38090 [Candidatus Heimdallarchaeota archaeon LC_3]|nr:MAG: hypothetical protein HeimC3_38090 [Candidatus Heimdallarchaeota archaeon LC_3]